MTTHDSTDTGSDFGFLLVPGFSNLCLANAVEPLRAVNGLTGRRHYRHQLLSADGRDVHSSSGIRIGVDAALADVPRLDALFVIAGADYRAADTPALRRALHRAARYTPLMGGLDTGPWFLAAAELLNARDATVHWQEREAMRAAFPRVRVQRSRYVIDADRITAGGATAVLDLMLALIRRQMDAVTALDVMRLFLYSGERAADDGHEVQPGMHAASLPAAVATVIDDMQEHLDQPLTIATVAARGGHSQRTLERLFRRSLGVTPACFYRYLRLTAARRLLIEERCSVTRAAVSTGFRSANAFARAYRHMFGHPPGADRRPGMSAGDRRA